MTASVAYDPKRLTGYRLEQLAAAFDRVRNPRDWKAPVVAEISVTERHVVEQAVLWFTDTVPVFVAIPGATERLVVRAPGYRLGGAETRHGHLRGPADQAIAGVVPAEPWNDVGGWTVPVPGPRPARPARIFDRAESAGALSASG
jgi:hypothetical protein